MQSARPVLARVGACLSLLASLTLTVRVNGDEVEVRGYWQEPSGAVIQIASCARGLCLTLVAMPRGDHPVKDVNNPDINLRTRALCGLLIGQDFTQIDSQRAEGGHVYDPRSGLTYHGSITVQGNTLQLRGYIGFKLLGRTQTWRRVGQNRATCTPQRSSGS